MIGYRDRPPRWRPPVGAPRSPTQWRDTAGALRAAALTPYPAFWPFFFKRKMGRATGGVGSAATGAGGVDAPAGSVGAPAGGVGMGVVTESAGWVSAISPSR